MKVYQDYVNIMNWKEIKMTQEQINELVVREIMVNQQMLKAIIILLSPSRKEGIDVIKECRTNIEKAFQMVKEDNNEISTDKSN